MKIPYNKECVLELESNFSEIGIIDNEYFIGVCEIKENKPNFIKIRKVDKNNNVIGVCRISTDKPEYITGYNENMILNKDIKNKLIDLLNKEIEFKPATNKNFPLCNYEKGTNWQFILDSFNLTNIKRNSSNIISLNTKIPDYTKLKED